VSLPPNAIQPDDTLGTGRAVLQAPCTARDDGSLVRPTGDSPANSAPDRLLHGARAAENRLRAQADFYNASKVIWPVQSPPRNISLFVFPNFMFTDLVPPRRAEGRIAIVTSVGCGMRWAQWGRSMLIMPTDDPAAHGQVVRS
jgi:hypothetical protein